MSYTHNKGYSAIDSGFATGRAGAEVQAISPTGQLYQSGTAITPTALELNVITASGITNADLVKVHGVTLTAAQINAAAIVLAGGKGVQSGASSVVIALAGTAVAVTVTFAVAFATIPNITVGVTTATGDAGYNNVRASAVSATAVTFTGNSYLAQTLGFTWIGIG